MPGVRWPPRGVALGYNGGVPTEEPLRQHLLKRSARRPTMCAWLVANPRLVGRGMALAADLPPTLFPRYVIFRLE
jgi:hypothetical protein